MAVCALLWLPPAAIGAGDRLVREPDRTVEAIPAAERPRGNAQVVSGRQDFSPRIRHPARVEREKERAARDLAHGADSERRAATGSGGNFAPLAAIFSGLNEPGLEAGNGSPPDATGAIGPSDYVEMVNDGGVSTTGIGLFSRSNLAQTAVSSLDDFIGFPGEAVFDPQVKWDPQANRFFFVADDCPDPDCLVNNFLAFGWSKTADPGNLVSEGPDLPANPAADWCTFFIPTGLEFHDYPKLGSNDNHLIIGANSFVGNPFVTAVIWAIPKPAPGTTTCNAPTAFRFGTALNPLLTADGDDALTPVPASTFTPAANGYVVASDFLADAEIMAWHVSGPAGSPTLTADGNIGVSPFGIPPAVPQPGTSDTLDSLDSRLTQAQADADPGAGGAIAVWTQHTIAGGGGSVVRWYELLPGLCSAGSCPAAARRQQGEVSSPSHYVFNGAISPAPVGDAAVINYNVGSGTLLPEIRASSRQATDPLGQMSAEEILGMSSTFTEEFTCQPAFGGPPCRWGDYAGASPDPLNANVVWGSNQLIGPVKPDPLDPHWTTRNFALLADHFPPQTSITSGPAEGATTGDSTPTFGFTASESATFQCSLDGPAFGACSGPGASHTTAALTPGEHTFRVRAIDAVGNLDPTPASRIFTFVPPVETEITGTKVNKRRGKATFRFRAKGGTPPYAFECKLTGKRAPQRLRAFRGCTSPKTYKRLKRGRYRFAVRAIDAEGIPDRTPAKKGFRSTRRG